MTCIPWGTIFFSFMWFILEKLTKIFGWRLRLTNPGSVNSL